MLNNKQAARGVINLYRSTKSLIRSLFYPKKFQFKSIKNQKYNLLYDTALDYHSWKHFKQQQHQANNQRIFMIFISSLILSTFAFTLRYNQVEAYTYYIMYPKPMRYFDIAWDRIQKNKFFALIPSNRYQLDGFWSRRWQELSFKEERAKRRDQRALRLKQELNDPKFKYQ